MLPDKLVLYTTLLPLKGILQEHVFSICSSLSNFCMLKRFLCTLLCSGERFRKHCSNILQISYAHFFTLRLELVVTQVVFVFNKGGKCCLFIFIKDLICPTMYFVNGTLLDRFDILT